MSPDVAFEARTRVLAAIEAAADELVAFTAQTVRAPSVTGSEGVVAVVYAHWLEEHGFDVALRPVPEAFCDRLPFFAAQQDLPGRPNVYGWLEPPSGRPVLVLNGHIDVMPAEGDWSRPPFAGEVEDGRIWGRGAADMKAGLAAGLFAVSVLRDAGVELACDVQVQGVIAEEVGGLGTLWALATEPRPSAAIVLEPTDGVVAPACGGMLPFEIEVSGRAVHTSAPWAGVSAYEKLQLVESAVRDFASRRESGFTHPLFERLPIKAPLAIGTVRAGDDPRTLPDRASFAGRIGALPGEELSDLRDALAGVVAAAGRTDPWLHEHPPTIRTLHQGRPAWETPASEPIVHALRTASELAGGHSEMGAMTFGTDATHFVGAGVPVVLFGPGRIADAHTTDEFVDAASVIHAARVLALGILEYSRALRQSQSDANPG